MSSSSDDEDALALLQLINVQRHRRYWVHPVWRMSQEHRYFKMMEKLCEYPDRFPTVYKMSLECFHIVLSKVRHGLQKKHTNWREPICPEERLLITLRYLATGIQFRQLAFSFRISKSAISTIVPQVCKAIWTQLVRKHMPEPSEDSFKNIAQCFWDRWQFPNCIGCIDGKHIRIKKPKQSGSMYYNYKSFFSIGLLAVTDANYKFVMINVGSYGKDNDAGVFEECPFRRAIEQGRLKIPKEQVLPGSNIISPYVLLGDAAFPLKKYLLRPFPEKSTVKGDAKDNYNYHLSRARMVVECSFGSITSKFRILHKSIETNVTNAVHIVKAICLLHNIIRDLESINENELMSFRKGKGKRQEKTLNCILSNILCQECNNNKEICCTYL
ncbi:unnamed protein product [Acanthoscelides obtectus]|uniref:DDE Tnp4 domain-containing protein n=1 Tax=Acanthoscelides obtectus TaxID=200917 RepID=A0A9P0M4E6_ACAOB|nr:unnamed protein product [Acanthoscelides obtectus]CAK1680451.1 Protein ALP1-like [Acanthoscelides obtectus]